jgi:hypothetical protein
MSDIAKSDLESKLREIEGVVTEVEAEAKSNLVTIAFMGGVVVIGVVALMVWRSRRSKIRVEVYKT